MYDFSKQKAMLEVSLKLLEENDLLNISTLGGGTALAGYYWNHRYSTDIDIFIYDKENKTYLLKPSNWSDETKANMADIGYGGIFKHNDIYTEIFIDNDSKIQFFDVVKKSKNPYKMTSLWGIDLMIDSIEEIIAKKIFFRGDKGNSRDIFDIAVAFHQIPDLLTKTLLKKEKIQALYENIASINSSDQLFNLYLEEIKIMQPNSDFHQIANYAIPYLTALLENIIASYNIGFELSSKDFLEIEQYVYANTIKQLT